MRNILAIVCLMGLGVFVFGLATLNAPPALAGCTWKFDWYCSDCAKIGGRTTGEQGGYPSEAACDSARDQVRAPVSAMSCDRVGTCDEPRRSTQSSPNRSSGGGKRAAPRAPPQPDYEAQRRRQAEIRRQEESRLKAARERKAREQRAFEKAKADILGALKGSNLDQGGALKGIGGGSTLQLKSGTPTFGIKANPGGQLRLKGPGAVQLNNPQTASINPAFFTRPKARLRIRYVPNPMQAPKGAWKRYVRSDRAGLILDALEEGRGDLDQSIAYLEGQIIKHGTHVKASTALSYLEGLKTSYIAAGEQYKNRAKKAGQTATLESSALLQAVLAASGPRKWPGPKNPDPGAKPLNKHDWRVQRADKMLAALEATPGDLEKTYRALQGDKDTITADNAEHYLRGVFAYWDYLGRKAAK
ncbi:MAG: hypothetical protein O3B76_02815 [Proteobacteria bacterium]|nr:hypothetical protein [Pseudomonadota bacterium]MDA1022089.1 hypothetical protein [Pseudomonadota bacterium]